MEKFCILEYAHREFSSHNAVFNKLNLQVAELTMQIRHLTQIGFLRGRTPEENMELVELKKQRKALSERRKSHYYAAEEAERTIVDIKHRN